MGNSSHRAFMPFSFKEANKEGEEAKSHFLVLSAGKYVRLLKLL